MRRGLFVAVLSGLSIGFSCLIFGLAGVPFMVIGVLSGAVNMIGLYLHQRAVDRSPPNIGFIDKSRAIDTLSPWLILIVLALVISVPQITLSLKALDGPAFWIFNKPIDCDVFAQVYTWIFVAILLSLPVLKPSREQIAKIVNLWFRRIWQPFVAYCFFFGVAYVMAWSSMHVSNGSLRIMAR